MTTKIRATARRIGKTRVRSSTRLFDHSFTTCVSVLSPCTSADDFRTFRHSSLRRTTSFLCRESASSRQPLEASLSHLT